MIDRGTHPPNVIFQQDGAASRKPHGTSRVDKEVVNRSKPLASTHNIVASTSSGGKVSIC